MKNKKFQAPFVIPVSLSSKILMYLFLMLVAGCGNSSGGSDKPITTEISDETRAETNAEDNTGVAPLPSQEASSGGQGESAVEAPGLGDGGSEENADSQEEESQSGEGNPQQDDQSSLSDDSGLGGEGEKDEFVAVVEPPCHPLHLKHCLLPYPSDIWSEKDSASATGIRLTIPDNFIDATVMAELPSTFDLQEILNGSTGFSAATSVLFELASPPEMATLPADGGNSIIAINLATGERTPITVQLSEYARSDQVASPVQVIEIFPRSRWQFGQRYVVAVTNAVKNLDGKDYLPSEGFSDLLKGEGDSNYDEALDYLDAAGFAKEFLLSATVFTVRTEEEVTQPLRTLAERVYQGEHPVRGLWVLYGNQSDDIAAIVTGQVRVDTYRTIDGGVDYDRDEAKQQWIDFRLTLPRVANGQSAPVSIYGHGISISKESDFFVSAINAELGIATISIDQPNHGMRAILDDGQVLGLLAPRHLPRQIGMLSHSSLDFMSLLKALNSSLSGLDLLPGEKGVVISPVSGDEVRDGIADIDSSRIYYQGTSLGGVLGSTFLALAPTVKGAFLQVPGSGITRILSYSILWDEFFYKLMPRSANGAQALVLKAAVQHQIDYGDSINFLHYFRSPPVGIPAKPLGIVVAMDDGVVPNNSSMAMAELANLPLVGEELFPMPGLIPAEDFVDGYGVKQIPRINKFLLGVPFIDGLIIHTSFISPEGEKVMEEWLKAIVLAE